MRILGIIPARGGSKSIPYKNIYPLAGKPLLAYTIAAAKSSKLIGRTILTTDDVKIAAVGKRYGVEVPFMRPAELSGDTTPDLPVFEHALNWLKRHDGYVPDIIVHLRPTSPLKCGTDIDRATRLLIGDPKADSVRSVAPPPQTPFKMWTEDKKTGYLKPILTKNFPEVFKKLGSPYDMPRQILPRTLEYSAFIEVLRYNTIMKQHSMSGRKILPFHYDEWRNIDIDSMRELIYAEFTLKGLSPSARRKVNI